MPDKCVLYPHWITCKSPLRKEVGDSCRFNGDKWMKYAEGCCRMLKDVEGVGSGLPAVGCDDSSNLFGFLPTQTDQELSQSNGSKGWVSEAQRPIRASDYSNLQQVECQYQHYLLVYFCRTLPILSDPSGPSRFEQLTRHQSLTAQRKS